METPKTKSPQARAARAAQSRALFERGRQVIRDEQQAQNETMHSVLNLSNEELELSLKDSLSIAATIAQRLSK